MPATILAVLEPEAVEVLLADIGDAKVVARLLTTYLGELPLRVDRVVSPTARSAASTSVEEAAHVLKSTSMIVGAGALSALAAEIEQAGRVGVAPTDEQCEQLRALATSTEIDIREAIEGLDSGS